MAAASDRPLPSGEPEGEEEDEEEEEPDDDGEDGGPSPVTPPPRPPRPTFQWKPMTSLYIFLGFLGIWMLFDGNLRNQIAGLLGTSGSDPGPLYSLIGFGSNYLLLTMALAGAIEMLITALAYNFTTDWVKAAKVQSWSASFRKVQMAAIRSGKKDRLDALRPHQEKLARLSSEVSIAQFKGMAITYFLLILIYTWVGLVIAHAGATQQTINLGGAALQLAKPVVKSPAIPLWFLVFSLYTIPTSMIFRRVLKHAWLRRYAREHPPSPPAASATGAPGGSA